MSKFKLYFKRFIKIRYFIMDKISKKRYCKKYPKYLKSLGVNISTDINDIGWISPKVFFDNSNYSLISIGKNVTISFDVAILVHDGSIIQAAYSKNKRIHMKELIVKPVIIGNNVFIGAKSIILPGTIINDNVIIGAGSIVCGNIEGDSVYAGNPAKRICSISEFYDKYKHLNQEIVGE